MKLMSFKCIFSMEVKLFNRRKQRLMRPL